MNAVQSHTTGWNDQGRIIWALAVKDIVEALKNKSTLVALLMLPLMVFFYRYMGQVRYQSEPLHVRVYAPLESSLVAALENSPALRAHVYESEDRMLDILAAADAPEIGLVLPADLAPDPAEATPLVIDGYLMRWLTPEQAAEVRLLAEQELGDTLGRPVRIDLSSGLLDIRSEEAGPAVSMSFSVIFCAIIIGVSVVPLLMLEEKKTRTLETLLVSPASPGHIVMGKALAGLFWGALAGMLALAVSARFISHWPLALLALLLVSLFMVAVGLLVGSIVEVRAQQMLYGWFVIIPLLLPVFLVLMEDLIPAAAVAVMRWIPTVAAAQVLGFACVPGATVADVVQPLAILAGGTVLALALVVRIVKRFDR
jgi:ABC-2 type transport system permease protein